MTLRDHLRLAVGTLDLAQVLVDLFADLFQHDRLPRQNVSTSRTSGKFEDTDLLN